MMLAAYLDASGMTDDSKYGVMAGFVALVEKWAIFEQDWAELLGEPKYASVLPIKNGQRYAHARKMRQWKKITREQFYLETNYLLKRTVSFAVSAVIKRSEFDKAYEKFPLTTKDSLYGYAFRAVVVACCKNIAENYSGESLAVVLESGDKNQGGARIIFNDLHNSGKVLADAKHQYPLETFSISGKERWGALQVADMHAYCVRQHMNSPLASRFGDGSKEHFGDINILLSNLNHLPFRISKRDTLNQRRIHIQRFQRRKEFGKRKYGKA